MRALRWILLIWSAIGLTLIASQPLIVPQIMTPTHIVMIGLSVTFYVLNLVFLWRSKPGA